MGSIKSDKGKMMICTKTMVETLKITNVDRLDAITVFLEDIKEHHGRITIECFGKSWSSYWGGIGKRSIADFFASCDNGYLIGNLSSGTRQTVNDFDNLDKHFYNKIIEYRIANDLTKEDARELWEDVDLNCENSEGFLHTNDGRHLAQSILGDDWWHDLPETENHEYIYLSRIIDAVKQAIAQTKKESGDVVLKPCPFCGSPAGIMQAGNADGTKDYLPCCTNFKCHASGYFESKEAAIKAWNTRADV